MTHAERLAAWTTLSPESFGDIYTSVADPNAAPRWPVIGAKVVAQTPEATLVDAVVAACQIAEGQGFLLRLARAITRVECENRGRDRSEAGALIAAIGGDGVMQAINDRVRGLVDVSIFQVLDEACEAFAIVYNGGKQLGTGLLVGPDLVLTAAHVVLAQAEIGTKRVWQERLLPDLRFSFEPVANNASRQRVDIPAAMPGGLVAWSLPHGDPPRKLRASLASPANEHLDFALVRLAKEVRHVRPLRIDPPADPDPGRDCFVIGFPGGSALKYGSDPIELIDRPSGRLVHRANTVHGMSGGGCFSDEGRLIGLHEGSLPRITQDGDPERNADGIELSDNRGILLSAIRAKSREAGGDPFVSKRKRLGLEFSDPAMVERLYREGVRLGGASGAAEWRAHVEAVLNLQSPPGDGVAAPRFHPWLPRRQLEDWFDTNRPHERVFHIIGPPGCGKSFCIDILRGKLESGGWPESDLVRIDATQTSAWAWEDAISPFLTLQAPELRTTVGAIRYDDVPAIVELLSGRRGVDVDPARRLHVAIDFEAAPDGVRIDAAPWRSFIEALAREDWARILVIGMGDDERREIADLLDANPLTEGLTPIELRLAHLTEGELATYGRQLFRARGIDIPGPKVHEKVAEVWRHEMFGLHVANPNMQTLEVALAAMMLERSVADV